MGKKKKIHIVNLNSQMYIYTSLCMCFNEYLCGYLFCKETPPEVSTAGQCDVGGKEHETVKKGKMMIQNLINKVVEKGDIIV